MNTNEYTASQRLSAAQIVSSVPNKSVAPYIDRFNYNNILFNTGHSIGYDELTQTFIMVKPFTDSPFSMSGVFFAKIINNIPVLLNFSFDIYYLYDTIVYGIYQIIQTAVIPVRIEPTSLTVVNFHYTFRTIFDYIINVLVQCDLETGAYTVLNRVIYYAPGYFPITPAYRDTDNDAMIFVLYDTPAFSVCSIAVFENISAEQLYPSIGNVVISVPSTPLLIGLASYQPTFIVPHFVPNRYILNPINWIYFIDVDYTTYISDVVYSNNIPSFSLNKHNNMNIWKVSSDGVLSEYTILPNSISFNKNIISIKYSGWTGRFFVKPLMENSIYGVYIGGDIIIGPPNKYSIAIVKINTDTGKSKMIQTGLTINIADYNLGNIYKFWPYNTTDMMFIVYGASRNFSAINTITNKEVTNWSGITSSKKATLQGQKVDVVQRGNIYIAQNLTSGLKIGEYTYISMHNAKVNSILNQLSPNSNYDSKLLVGTIIAKNTIYTTTR